MTGDETSHGNLRRRLEGGEAILAPGVFDMISARLADRKGFGALYMTGYGVAASHLGVPDAGIATFTDMVGRVAQIAHGTTTPLIADADTGYGGLVNVQNTVRGYERAGAAAIQLEDQVSPKKCGHLLGRDVIATEEMVRKIEVALSARENPDFLIIARTDARTVYGLDEALRRAEAYRKAGADILFIESPESEDELSAIAGRFDVPLVANMVQGGRTPLLPYARLVELGFRLILYPALGFLSAAAALDSVYSSLRDGQHTETPLFDFEQMSVLMGFDQVRDLERRFAGYDDITANETGTS